MRADYSQWLKAQQYSESTQSAQLFRVKKVEESYGNLDDHFKSGTYQEIIDNFQYSAKDERMNKPNPSKLKFDGNIRHNLQDYKNAVVRYRKFLNDKDFTNNSTGKSLDSLGELTTEQFIQEKQQRFSLERDMQAALRKNIKSLDPSIKIIDDGAERSVKTGFIDITCEDTEAIVVVELKAGMADSRAIGQILGYIGDLLVEEDGRKIKGILVAHDFDERCKAAARAVSNLTLKKYSIEFKFASTE
jgi:hypothetical protein